MSSMQPGVWISPSAAASSSGTADGADKSFEHVQTTPSDQWIVQHNLGKYASVTVIDAEGDIVECAVHYDSRNQITLSFSPALAGVAVCN